MTQMWQFHFNIITFFSKTERMNVQNLENEEEDELQVNDMGIVIIPGVNDLPEFANLESRKIHDDNLLKRREIEEIIQQAAEMQERVKVMQDHYKNVQQEVDHTNSLNSAKQSEIKSEGHLHQLSSRALGRAQSEAKRVHGEIDFVKDQLNLVQSQIYKANEKLDEIKMQMNWNQEELEQWALAARQKEEDFIAIEKYKRSDEQKIKDLTLQLEQLTKENIQQRAKLENEATDTQAKQMELDRVAQDFKIAHAERQELVNRWQDTIAEMKKRDKEINDLGERFAVAKVERAKKEVAYNQQKARLHTQQGENKEVELRSETLARIVLRKREEMMTGNIKLNEFRGELESLKNELTTAAEKLILKKTNNANKSNQVEETKVQLDRERQKYQVVKAKIENAKNNNIKAEQKAKQAEDELNEQEKEYSAQLSKVKQLKEKSIKESQLAFELKTEETRLRSEIAGSKSISRNLDGQLNQLDKEAARQQELLYNAEFQIQQIERKIARGMGERSDEEKLELKKQISGLEEQMDSLKEKRKLLQQQNRKLQNELANLRTKKESLSDRFKKLSEILGEKELENKMIEDEIKRDTKVFEEITVQNDLLLLEVKKLKDLLSAKSDAVFSLENRKQQLLLSMEERKQEIAVHSDLLRAELKALQEDRHRITLELRQRQANVERLKARFEATSKDDGSEKQSQAYYVIKAAQKREELQRRGDQLDQDVRKCEKEIRALQLTLDHLNARNIAYRESFQKIDIKGDDAEVLVQLEDRIKHNKDNLFRKKKDLQRLITDFDEDSRRLEQVQFQCDKIRKQKEHLENAEQQVEEELMTQEAQLAELRERMIKSVERHRAKFVENGGDLSKFPNGTLEEKSVRAEVIRDVVQVKYFLLSLIDLI
jgi:chromosome segregation ATPase